MPAFSATAPGKTILLGEHAVVYGRPALATPVQQVQARAVVRAQPQAPAGSVRIQAPDIQLDALLTDLPPEQPLAFAIRQTCQALKVSSLPACAVRVSSTIPFAAGLGSGAAVSVAIIRALAAFLGHPLADEMVSALAFEVEKLHHGTPSGIDNTVITYGKPVFFQRGVSMEILTVGHPFTLVIGDTGIASPTGAAVADLRRNWQADPARYDTWFDQIGQIVLQARPLIEAGTPERLGPLMNQNHEILSLLGVSSPELDQLVLAARKAGALGAKLSGGGRGGNMIALVSPATVPAVAQALHRAGAVGVIITEVRP
jgi:mevalonate kinase